VRVCVCACACACIPPARVQNLGPALLADVKTVQVVINSHLNRQGCTVLSERFRNAIGNRACAILRFGVMMHWRLVNRMMYWRLVNRMMHWRLVDALASS